MSFLAVRLKEAGVYVIVLLPVLRMFMHVAACG
jgi:hypothetical protein